MAKGRLEKVSVLQPYLACRLIFKSFSLMFAEIVGWANRPKTWVILHMPQLKESELFDSLAICGRFIESDV